MAFEEKMAAADAARAAAAGPASMEEEDGGEKLWHLVVENVFDPDGVGAAVRRAISLSCLFCLAQSLGSFVGFFLCGLSVPDLLP
jgi:hypothetical protein